MKYKISIKTAGGIWWDLAAIPQKDTAASPEPLRFDDMEKAHKTAEWMKRDSQLMNCDIIAVPANWVAD